MYRKPIELSNREVMENNAMVESYLKESIDGIETVKSLCADGYVKDTINNKFFSLVNAAVKNSIISISQNILAFTVEQIGIVVILWVGIAMVIAGQVSIGSLFTFYILLGYFTNPVRNLIELQPTIQSAFVAADRLHDVLDLEAEIKFETGLMQFPIASVWKMDGVSFRYGNNKLVLRNINLSIRSGERIAIVGESGCGKTTLVKLLLRFYEPESGAIMVNDKDISLIDILTLRKNVAYISADTFLFADTILNNLKLGNLELSEEDIIYACQISKAHEFIEKLPMGYQTVLDENGANLSSGQKQRLAIARAILQKPQLLIMDEATSNLDTITENAIRSSMDSLSKNISVITIAHRLSTVKKCDCIYVMKNGEIVESGTHEVLLETGTLYPELWNNQ